MTWLKLRFGLSAGCTGSGSKTESHKVIRLSYSNKSQICSPLDRRNMLLTRSAPWYIGWQSSSIYASLGPKPIAYGPWTVSALCLERFRCFVYYLPTISRTLYCRLGTQRLQHQSKLSSWYFHWSVKDLVSSMLVVGSLGVPWRFLWGFL